MISKNELIEELLTEIGEDYYDLLKENYKEILEKSVLNFLNWTFPKSSREVRDLVKVTTLSYIENLDKQLEDKKEAYFKRINFLSNERCGNLFKEIDEKLSDLRNLGIKIETDASNYFVSNISQRLLHLEKLFNGGINLDLLIEKKLDEYMTKYLGKLMKNKLEQMLS